MRSFTVAFEGDVDDKEALKRLAAERSMTVAAYLRWVLETTAPDKYAKAKAAAARARKRKAKKGESE